jgi:hypothetical protein
MQQDKNDIEEKLRQLDNQQLPDLSRMDEHWESMKLALQPTFTINQRKKKWLWFIGLLLVAGTTTLFIARKYTANEKEILSKVLTQQHEPLVDMPLADSFVSQQPVMPVTPVVKNAGKTKPVSAAILKPVAENKEVDLALQFDEKNSTLKAVNPDAQKILNELLGSLAKMAEEFVIDNSRDTTLFGAEGSSLYIPANSLGGGGEIKIRLKEFYKTSDIVLNKLSTTSNGEQLVTGGMVHISASVNDKPVNVLPGKAIKWFLPDTSKQMEQMQLFKGEERKAGGINWINTGQGFNSPGSVMEVWVLDLRNEPFKTKEVRKGTIGFFTVADNKELSNSQLKETIKDKYGYYKVKIRRSGRDGVFKRFVSRNWRKYDGVGDSAWVSKQAASLYNLPSSQTRIRQGYAGLFGNVRESYYSLNRGRRPAKVVTGSRADSLPGKEEVFEFGKVSAELEKRYSVDINSLGWINCDRFYNDRREKISYYVDLQDTAINYFTMMVFSKMRSMMTGYIIGNKVQFDNVPVGESVKIISIGVDRKGETVMAMQEIKISKKGLTGMPFESAAAPEIRSSLNKIDN